jgi:serine/threonine-protein kinase
MAAALEKALAPAPAREIGEWVHSIAGDALDWRQELVHRIESETSSSIPPPMRRDSPAPSSEVSSGVVPTDGPDDGRDQAPTISNENNGGTIADDERETLLATSRRTPAPSVLEHDDGGDARDDEGRPRIGLVAMVVAGVAFVGAGVLFGMRWVQMSTEPAPAAEPATRLAVPLPAESESAIVIGGGQRTPPGGASAAQGATTPATAGTAQGGVTGAGIRGGVVPVGSTPVRPIVRGGTVATAAPSHDDCDNPFTVDARGIRHPKPQCFNKK